MNLFWSHTIWYLLLGLAIVIQVIYTLYHSENRMRTFAFYLSIVGLPLYFETFILIFFDAYTYSPEIIRSPNLDPFNDVLTGNLFSQFGVASSALLLTIRRKSFHWGVIVAFLYCMLEEFFKALDIYQQHWWKTWMTFIGLLLLFTISKWLYAHIVRGVRPIYYYGYIVLAMFPVSTILFQWGVLDLLGLMRFTEALSSNPQISRFGIWITFVSISYPIIVWGYFQQHLKRKIAAVTLVGAIIYFGYKSHLIIFRAGLFVPISILLLLWMCLSVWMINILYSGRPKCRCH
ncbi:hypothetical protein AMQ84_25845 [Paenibacillus riograndensis]|uniref:Uncharacterized protein n=1 Tax=Paenibacillus riograndensis TaxID=483937 RepID=A0A132TLR5_9BACL|nr:hypothetical protein [Paenibacillus riograndensis]KWX72113.1 hypothetical protein AMQ84_25845 [Paenibacillus riograndensis]